MPHGPPPSPPPSPPLLPFSFPLPLPVVLPTGVFAFDSLDFLFSQDLATTAATAATTTTTGIPGAVGPGDPTVDLLVDAFGLDAAAGTTEHLDNSHPMTLLDTAMLDPFENLMAVNIGNMEDMESMKNVQPEPVGPRPIVATTSGSSVVGAQATTAARHDDDDDDSDVEIDEIENEIESNNGEGEGEEVEVTVESIARAENQFNTASNNVPGAGPNPPATFSSSLGNLAAGGSNTLTEFTKRRNWPAKVVEELKDLLQILDANGRIKYVSPNITSLAGYSPDEIRDVFLKDLIHPDDQGVYVAELNASISSGTPMRIFYRFKKKDGTWTIFEAVGHAHIGAARFAPNPSNQSPFCQAVFMMARLYPTKNASLLDSFLEHKIENERLKRRIAELRREEEAEADEAYRSWMQSQEGRSDMTLSEDTGGPPPPPASSLSIGVGVGVGVGAGAGASSDGTTSIMPHVAAPGDMRPLGNTALTRENLEGAAAGKKQDSLRDKMERYEATASRYEAPSHTDTIEMLTGLRYVEGERSRGITTGDASPMLIKGDAGIRIPMDRENRHADKKKKLKTAEEYVCTDCGTLDSPEWRKGPSGPKTLCNACGLRWAKKEKKRSRHGGMPEPSLG